jgi:hypothetical protein
MVDVDRGITIQGQGLKTGVGAMAQLVNKRTVAFLIVVASLLAIASAMAAIKATGPGMMGGGSGHGMMGSAFGGAGGGGAGANGTATPTVANSSRSQHESTPGWTPAASRASRRQR